MATDTASNLGFDVAFLTAVIGGVPDKTFPRSRTCLSQVVRIVAAAVPGAP
jgi:hypothetical protein